VPKFVYDFTEGNRGQKDLLGGKGANLSEMTNLGLPVPPGFVITTEACRAYLESGSAPPELHAEVSIHLEALESQMGKRLGQADDPLLVSVRSGAKFSMPGMMETVLNIGLNDESVLGLAKQSGTIDSLGTATAACCRCSERQCCTSRGSTSRTRWTPPRRPREPRPISISMPMISGRSSTRSRPL